MAPKVFITGVTGYIGGDVLYDLYTKHPEYDYTVLVRNTTSGSKVASAFPKVRLVYGDLDSSDLISSESAKANIVVHTADSSDHRGAAVAITKGLASHSASEPGFYIHLSGTGILTYFDASAGRSGEKPNREPFNDLSGVEALTSLPDEAFHRDIDKLVLAANAENVKTAILCPPVIYGVGRGPGNQRSKQVPLLAEQTLKQGREIRVGKGLAEWDVVHMHDLSALFTLLVERAASSSEKQSSDDGEVWGLKGYFFTENGHVVWGEVAQRVADVASEKGLIDGGKDVMVWTHDQAVELAGFIAATWGLNSRGKGERARKFLGWKPKERGLMEEVPDIVEVEAKMLGLLKGHKEKVEEASE